MEQFLTETTEVRQQPVAIYSPPESVEIQPSLYMSVTFTKPGNTSRLTKGERDLVLRKATEQGVNPALLRATKTLWESSSFDRIVKFDKEKQHIINRIALPAMKILKAGFYRIGIAEVEQWQKTLSLWRDERESLVDVFIGDYAEARELAKRELGPLYRDEQYLTTQQLIDSFNLKWAFFQLCIPRELEEASRVATQQARSLLASLTQETLEECRVALRSAFYALVKRSAERLRVREDGSKEIFRDSLVSGMQEFLDSFAQRNAITGDRELSALVEQARAVFAQVKDPDKLRDNLQLRERVQQTMQQVQETMDRGLMLVAGGVEIDVNLDS